MQRPERIRAVKLAPNKPAEEVILTNTLEGLQAAVAEGADYGMIEFVRLEGNESLMLHEEGKLIGLEANRRLSSFGFDVRDVLCGTIYIVADYYDEEAEDTYLVDLPEDRVKFYLEAYKEPEQIDEEEVFHSICMEFFGM